MAHLVLSDIGKTFGTTAALREVNFECRDGELLCLLGPSGAGKTTTINVISGLTLPERGRVLLDGEDITERLPQQRNMATAFENYALYPHLTVYDNLAFPLRAPVRQKELVPAELDRTVRAMANILAIEDLLHRLPKELSGGQRQRVALGRALIRRPRLYLLDEPIAHLDAKLRHRMRGELRRIQMEYGISTIYSTPDQLEALSMADRIVVLHQGRVEQMGAPAEIYNHPANTFVARFVGDPPMNLLPARLVDGRMRVLAEAGPFDFPLSGQGRPPLGPPAQGESLTIGVRPRDLQILAPSDSAARAHGVAGEIDVLGQYSVVTVRIGDLILKVKTPTAGAPARGSPVGLQFDPRKLHYFDGGTGMRIPTEV